MLRSSQTSERVAFTLTELLTCNRGNRHSRDDSHSIPQARENVSQSTVFKSNLRQIRREPHGLSSENNRPVAESRVLAPADMIAIGDRAETWGVLIGDLDFLYPSIGPRGQVSTATRCSVMVTWKPTQQSAWENCTHFLF